MKSISKLTLIAAFAAFFAQSASAQVSFGLRAGLNYANMSFSDDEDEDLKGVVSFQIGGTVEAPITETVGIRTGLELQGKGVKSEYSEQGVTAKSSITPMYLQVPVVVAYNGPMFFVGAGPYAGFGIAGKSKSKVTGLGTGFDLDETENLKFGSSEDDDLSSVDFGARIEAGVKVNKLRVGVNFDLGLANAFPKDVRDGESAKHSVLGLFVGYIF